MLATKSEIDLGGGGSPASLKVANYDRYLAQGPVSASHSEIEMTRFGGGVDQMPLLDAPARPGYFDPMVTQSNVTLPSLAYGVGPGTGSGSPSPTLEAEQHMNYPAMTTTQDPGGVRRAT